MLIIGAKGFAKEVLEVIYQGKIPSKIAFYDDVNTSLAGFLYDQFEIIKSGEEAGRFFREQGNAFCLGIGNPMIRKKMADRFSDVGGDLTSIVSPKSSVGSFGTTLGKGVCIMTGVIITNDVMIGDGCLVNLNVTIGHDCMIGEFCELSPGVHVSGKCTIGKFCNIGTGAVLLPGISVGDHCVIGAGAVVTKNIAPGSTVAGIPAKPLVK